MDLGARLGVIFEVSLGMKKLLGILILGLMFCTSSLADNLKNYKYKNYKKNDFNGKR
jgi:hypothetical protein